MFNSKCGVLSCGQLPPFSAGFLVLNFIVAKKALSNVDADRRQLNCAERVELSRSWSKERGQKAERSPSLFIMPTFTTNYPLNRPDPW